jgi:hypothetical protein
MLDCQEAAGDPREAGEVLIVNAAAAALASERAAAMSITWRIVSRNESAMTE